MSATENTNFYVYPSCDNASGLGSTFISQDLSARNIAVLEKLSSEFVRYSFCKYGGGTSSDGKTFFDFRYLSDTILTGVTLNTFNQDKPFPIGTIIEIFGS